MDLVDLVKETSLKKLKRVDHLFLDLEGREEDCWWCQIGRET